MTKERDPQTCPQCHRTFIPNRTKQKYCSPSCQRRVAGIFDQGALTQRICPTCGTSFLQKQSSQKYCSRACHYGHDAAWKQATATKECPWCHQVFTPRRRGQRYCSQVCAHGAALQHIQKKHINSPEDNERRRQVQLKRVEDGSHPFLRPRPENTKQLPTPAPKNQPPTMPTLPPLPDVPEEDTDTQEESNGGEPLTFPLLGEESRREWMLAGEMREAQADRALDPGERPGNEGRTIILAGQGSYLGVEGFTLVVHQGRTHGVPAPAKEFLQPALHSVKRIFWIAAHGHAIGTLTLAATAWCQREGIHLTALDGAGMPLFEVMPSDIPQDTGLRRTQWLLSSGLVLPGSPTASALVREIILRKIRRQHHTLQSHTDLPGRAAALKLFEQWQAWLALGTSGNRPRWQYDIGYLRKAEGRLASLYFRSWEGWPLQWSKPDIRRVPPHWLRVRARISPLSPVGNGRHAIDPANAALNYCYGVLAAQCRQALLSEGLDPMAGFLHADKPGRDSLTWDLTELARADVDSVLLDFLSRTTLHYGDFARSPDGKLLIHPQLTRLLIAECRINQTTIDGYARWLRRFMLTGEAGEA